MSIELFFDQVKTELVAFCLLYDIEIEEYVRALDVYSNDRRIFSIYEYNGEYALRYKWNNVPVTISKYPEVVLADLRHLIEKEISLRSYI